MVPPDREIIAGPTTAQARCLLEAQVKDQVVRRRFVARSEQGTRLAPERHFETKRVHGPCEAPRRRTRPPSILLGNDELRVAPDGLLEPGSASRRPSIQHRHHAIPITVRQHPLLAREDLLGARQTPPRLLQRSTARSMRRIAPIIASSREAIRRPNRLRSTMRRNFIWQRPGWTTRLRWDAAALVTPLGLAQPTGGAARPGGGAWLRDRA